MRFFFSHPILSILYRVGDLNVPERPNLKCLGFTYNEAKLFNMLPIKMKQMEDPNTFKTMTVVRQR